MNHIHRNISNAGTVAPDRALWAMDGLWGVCLALLLHGPSSAQDWQHNNRNLSLYASRTVQRYSEQDTQILTADGVLESEAGHPTGWGHKPAGKVHWMPSGRCPCGCKQAPSAAAGRPTTTAIFKTAPP